MKNSLLFLALFIISPAMAVAQWLYIGIGPGYSVIRPLEVYAASSVDALGHRWSREVKVVDGQKYDKGYSGHARLRFRLPSLPLSLIGGVGYTKVLGETEQVLATTPPWSSSLYESGSLETKLDLLTVSAGLRWDLFRTSTTPYLVALASYNRFGEMTLTIKREQVASIAKVDAINRGGVALGGGVTFAIQPSLRAEVELGYALQNAFGREGGEELRNAVSVSVLFSFKV